MAEPLAVLINGTIIGTVSTVNDNLLRFEYDGAYRRLSGATPLSLSMPLSGSVFADTPANRAVTNFLSGLLPDDDEIIRRWAGHYSVRTTSPFYILSTPVGRDCAGGVAFCPISEVDGFLARGGAIEWMSEAGVAEALRDLRRDPTLALGRAFAGNFSLAGAQRKTALRLGPDGRWGRPSGTEPTTHIFKPSSAGWLDHDINEHLCLTAAGMAGLRVARSSIQIFGDQEAIVSVRYDRDARGGRVARIHQEDMCQALGISPDKKYEADGGPTARDIAALLRRSVAPRDADAVVRAFADALIWNWIIMGTDAHAKNYSLLLLGSAVRLAPLYDVSSVLPYLGTTSPSSQMMIIERKQSFAMRIGSNRDVYPLRNPWARVGAELGIPPAYLVDRARTLASAAPAAFARAAADPAIAALRSDVAAKLVDRVGERAAACIAVLDR
jgi:serine/threonine-protein kinase HipA